MFGWVDLRAARAGPRIYVNLDQPLAAAGLRRSDSACVTGTGFTIQTSPVTSTTVVTITASSGVSTS
jgi:hypothetical protein